MKKYLFILITLFILIILAPHLLKELGRISPNNLDEKETFHIKFGVPKGNLPFLPLKIAEEEGFFQEENVNVEFVDLKPTDLLPRILHKDFDMALGFVGAGIFNAFARGVELQVIADFAQTQQYLLIRKDLWDNGTIKDLSDLKGKTIGITGQGEGVYYVLVKFLEQEGLDVLKDVKTIKLRASERALALEAKKIDASVSVGEPWNTVALENGWAVIYPKIEGWIQLFVIVTTEDAIQEKPEATKAFLRAYVKAIKFHNKAMEGVEPERSRVEVLKVAIMEQPEEIVKKMSWLKYNSDGKPDIESMSEQLEFFKKLGLIDGEIDINQLVNLEFLPNE
jgi:NitT/TauT family transport system substrate-binding protein